MSTATSNSTHPPSENRIGQVISGRYRIDALLGEGGMGAVYLAEHTLMRKRFALKLLHPEMANREDVLARFRREAEAAAHVEHPNIVAATDFGQTEDGAFFLVLEYVDGTSLRASLGAGPFSTGRALHVARQIALALERAHEAGIVHRDLKPENVMLVVKGDDRDFAKVLDFGVARFDGASAQFLTQVGTIMGSPSYMAPEQAVGDRVSHRADLYSLGVVLYEMLTGECPFEGDLTALLSKHIASPVPPMSERNPGITVPAPVEALVRKLLEKDANNRYQSARSLVEAMDRAAFETGLEITSPAAISGRISAVALAPSAAVESSPTPRAIALANTVMVGTKTSRGTDVSAALGRLSPYREKAASVLTPLLARMNAVLGRVANQLNVPKRVLLVVLAGAVTPVLVLTIVVVRYEAGRTKDGGLAAKLSSARQTASAEELHVAAARGPAALEDLAAKFPNDPALLRELAFSYDAAGRTAEALRAVRLIADADPKNVPRELVRLVMRAASKFETGDEAFRLLEGPLGGDGVDALIELAEGKDLPASTSMRAQKSLTKPTVRAKASAPSAFLLDLGDASTCEERHQIVTGAGSQADARALPTLRALESKRGCGRGRRHDCNPCLRKDDTLRRAIEAAQSNAAR